MFLTILNNFIDKVFYLCVDILNWSAKLIGISYELINIIIDQDQRLTYYENKEREDLKQGKAL